VVVGAAVEAVDVAAAGGDDRTREDGSMRSLRNLTSLAALVLATVALGAVPAGPRSFPSARDAADALVAAAAADDILAMHAIFGPEGKPLVSSGDEVQDRNDRAHFAALAKEKLEVVVDPKDPRRATVVAGPSRRRAASPS
jgi:hypothetical protein